MYRVSKDRGAYENVFLQNTDTMSEINLGRITPKLLSILEADGYKFSSTEDGRPEVIELKNPWALEISEAVKDKLRVLVMPIKKPLRRKVKTEQKQVNTEQKKEIVDVLDIIYGLKN